MGAGYTILVVSDQQNDIVEVQSKLTISRGIDTVSSCTLDKAIEFCRKHLPDVVIIFAREKNNKLYEVCKIIRLDSILNHIPIIFVFEEYDEKFILESLNAGISDYVIMPISKIDIMAHLNWSFKQSELICDIEIKETLLKDLEVIDRNSGAYLPKFAPAVINCHINISKKYKYSFIFMAISIDNAFKNKINSDYLAKVLRKILRSSDVVGIMEQGKFYVLLSGMDLKGVYSVHSKILKSLGDIFTISVGACESFEEMSYESLNLFATKILSDVTANGGNRILVLTPDQLKTFIKGVPDKQEEQIPEKQGSTSEPKNWLNKVQTSKKSYESFKKEFSKKVIDNVAPAFYKMRDNLKVKYPSSVIIDYTTADTKCIFSVQEVYEGTENVLQIIDPGLSNVKIERCLIKAGKPTTVRYNIELQDLTESYVERILQDLFNEFEIVSDLERLSKENKWY